MELKLLPVERLDELNAIYDMSRFDNFQNTREENLRSRREICVVAEEEGKFVGEISIMTENSNIPVAVIPNKRMYLFGLRVLPEFQNRGIGTALLKYAVTMCTRRGIFEFTIGVENDNEIARRLYEKLGFVTLLENCSEMQYGRMCKYDLLILKLR